MVRKNYINPLLKVVAVAFCSASICLVGNSASSLTYQSSTNVGFTFNPTISISLSGDLLISSLSPGSTSDSNIIDVVINTNASQGYTLTATAGTSSTTTNLVNTGNNNNIFTSLATNATITDWTNVNDNTWGYSYSEDNGTTWISGKDINNNNANILGYSGLPLDNDDNGETGKTLISTTLPSDNKTLKFKIGAKASSSQASGDYTNIINFYAVANPEPEFLYDKVAEMSKGTLAANNVLLTDAIETPTTDDYTTDTSNSGVYLYDPNVYGASSDASNSYPIYFYRGILEKNPTSSGSEGSAKTYPNYVRLSNNTCWRIVRTTGSGGVKMIYNGVWKSSQGTCANAGSNIGVASINYAAQGSSSETNWHRNVAYVGYTYNDDVTDSTSTIQLGTIFGNDAHPELNNTRSNIKAYIEDTWYANNMTSYTGMLEASAGYCNDRTVYNASDELQSESSINKPYGSYTKYYFGAYHRVENTSTIQTPSLTCPRGVVDLYRYVANSIGISNELKYPVALLTADEATLAGKGNYQVFANSSQSFLNATSENILLSPRRRLNNDEAEMFSLDSGQLGIFGLGVRSPQGLRPVISLIHATTISGGSGVFNDPWTINE